MTSDQWRQPKRFNCPVLAFLTLGATSLVGGLLEDSVSTPARFGQLVRFRAPQCLNTCGNPFGWAVSRDSRHACRCLPHSESRAVLGCQPERLTTLTRSSAAGGPFRASWNMARRWRPVAPARRRQKTHDRVFSMANHAEVMRGMVAGRERMVGAVNFRSAPPIAHRNRGRGAHNLTENARVLGGAAQGAVSIVIFCKQERPE